MPQFRKVTAQSFNRPVVQTLGREQNLRVTSLQTLAYGLGAEGRKQGTEHAGVLECAQSCNVKGRDSLRQREHPVLFTHPQRSQSIGETVCLVPELAKGRIPNSAIPPQPTERDVVPKRPGRVAVNCELANIKRIASAV
jgi:hypothetical protein